MDLPPILASRFSADEVLHELSLPRELDVFRGHFPDRPILSGVAQIDWAIQLGAQHWQLPAVARDFRVKFRNVITPETAVTLVLRFDRVKRHLHFEYRTAAQIMSAGRIAQ